LAAVVLEEEVVGEAGAVVRLVDGRVAGGLLPFAAHPLAGRRPLVPRAVDRTALAAGGDEAEEGGHRAHRLPLAAQAGGGLQGEERRVAVRVVPVRRYRLEDVRRDEIADSSVAITTHGDAPCLVCSQGTSKCQRSLLTAESPPAP